ncbi:MAG: TlpA family protein disulfide reductase [Stenotrophomonas sp.]
MRLLVLLLSLSISACLPVQAQEQVTPTYRAIQGLKVADGQEVPDFSSPINLASFRGKPLLINFYSAHCQPCLSENPKLNTLKHLNPELQFLAITPDSPEEAAEYAQKRSLAWPIATPGEEYMFKTLGVEAFPTFAIIDENGNLLSATYGNQLAGEDGHATLAGISDWVGAVLGKNLN